MLTKMSNKFQYSNLKKALSLALSVFFVITVCFCIFVAVQSTTRGYVSIGSTSFFRVITGSMEPSISVGELIMTDNVGIDEIAVEDVVCFKSKSPEMFGAIITHRVMDIRTADDGSTLLVTKGDANLSADANYVTEDNLIGKMVWSSGETAMSNIVAFLSSGSGFFICIVLPFLLILLIVLRENARSMKRDIDVLVKTMKEQEEANEAVQEPHIEQEEYDQMYERIRQELMEELNNSNESEQS